MRKFTAFLSFVVALGVGTIPADAQQPQPRTIEIRSFGNDVVGDLLVEALQSAFRAAPRYRMVLSGGEIGITVSTMGLPEGTRDDVRGIYGLVWFIRRPDGAESYLSSTVGWTGREAVAQAAAGIVERTDSVLAKSPGPGADRRSPPILGWD
jgi:hypothetical protein